MLKNGIVAFAVLLGVAPAVISLQLSPVTNSGLDEIYLSRDLSAVLQPASSVFGMIQGISSHPGGAIFTRGCEDEPLGTVSIPSGFSVSRALDVVAGVFPNNYWTVREGAINFLPKLGLPAVMDVRIEHVVWTTSDIPIVSAERLFQSSAVKRRLAELSIKGSLRFGGLQKPPRIVNGVPEPPPKGQEWKFENVRLLTALNQVIASYGNRYWIYTERTCGNAATYQLQVQ